MKKKILAFTLIEAMVIVALIGIMMAIGVPGMQSFMTNTSMTSTTNDLVIALQFSRSEAIKRGDRVVICASDQSMVIPPICNPAADWHEGWIVFHDLNNDSLITGAEEVLRVQPAVATNGLTITEDVLAVGDPITIAGYVSFTSPRGAPQQTNTINQSGLFRICMQGEPDRVRGVMINASGRITSSRDSSIVGVCP